MTGLYFSRAALRRSPDIDALARTLAPDDPNERLQTDHRLVWSLFAGDAETKRDFLFRREDRAAAATRARFLILSRRPPNAQSALFEVETQDFAPALAKGDRLGFSLLANPAVTHWREAGGQKRRFRDDVVMHALSGVPREERAARRPQIVETAGRDWLNGQAARAGFALDEERLKIDGYDQFAIDRGAPRRRAKKNAIAVSVLSFDGELTVEDPSLFLQRLAEGFGRARAFGCGLMLIRRAR
jgi:CRISPR system Cascade subunit CasE